MRIGTAIGFCCFFASFVICSGTEERSKFVETISGKVPYWEFGSESSEAVWFQVSRTSALEYSHWLDSGEPGDGTRDEANSFYRFSLDLAPGAPFHDEVLPQQVEMEIDDERVPAIVFLSNEKSERNRIVFSLEIKEEGGNWIPDSAPETVFRETLGSGLERTVWKASQPLSANASLRLRMRAEPAPMIFAHYISDLSPGSGAMAHLMKPMPAFFRLFHDRAENLEPVPRGLPETFTSTGGPHRDLPLIPPGFSFSNRVKSAELEIARAQRIGLDGFAVNCLEGKTDQLAALLVAAKKRREKHPDEKPFLVGLAIDINVLPFAEGKMLPTVANLISQWMALAENLDAEEHLARRGGKPLVMGYQSHWIWADYLHRLLEYWEWKQPTAFRDSRLQWSEDLGSTPVLPKLPKQVGDVYETVLKQQRFEENDPELQREIAFFRRSGLAASVADKQARNSLSARKAREAAVEVWMRMPDGWGRMRDAYRVIEQLVGEEIFWQFDAVDLDAVTGNFEEAVMVVGRDFPAVNFFLPKGEFTSSGRRIVREQGAEWGEPIFAQYVAYGQNEQEGIFYGNARGGDGTATFRRGWSHAIGKSLDTGDPMNPSVEDGGRSSLIQFTTWNDYNEHTHLAPSLQMRFALGELTRHFIHTWKTGEPIGSLGEQLFLFYRKHPEGVQPFPFKSGTAFLPAFFEVVSILHDSGAELSLLAEADGEEPQFRSEKRILPRGFHVESFTGPALGNLWREGPVEARVRKQSGEVLKAVGWEKITRKPFREDTTLVGASSRCDELWEEERQEFGFPDFRFSEYGDADGDGMPNWFEMFYFGYGWLNLADQTVAFSKGDENRDGVSNVEHFRSRTHPTLTAIPIPYRETKNNGPLPFRIRSSGRTRIQAEDFDRGGAGLTYLRRSFDTIQGGAYRNIRYDLPTHLKADFHEEDGADWIVPFADGEWLSYTVEIPAGCFEVFVRIRGNGGKIRLELNEREIVQTEIESQDLWSTHSLGRFRVTESEAGRRILRLHFETADCALNWFEFRPCGR